MNPDRQLADEMRALRLVLATLENDAAQLMSVAEEAALDARGSDVALWQLTVTLAQMLGEQFVELGGQEGTVVGIRRSLLRHNTEGSIDG